jgi:3-oxoacyl-[acyl-carrier protein] reductase
MTLHGKVALVTGGSRGIGRAIAERLAHDGCAIVAFTYRANAQAAAEAERSIAAAGARPISLQADLASSEQIGALFDRLDALLGSRAGTATLDIVVNNAGNPGLGTLASSTPASFEETMGVHGRAPFFVIQAAANRLRDGGRVINITSGAAGRPPPGLPVYAMAKAGVNALTRALAIELGPRGITVNAVAPGWTATDLSAPMRADPEFVAKIKADTPLGRIGAPADIAPVVAFLASPEAGWVTGQCIEASGGHGL